MLVKNISMTQMTALFIIQYLMLPYVVENAAFVILQKSIAHMIIIGQIKDFMRTANS